MIPTVLKKAGYTTAMIGKWGQLLPSGDAAEWGFDHMLSFKASGIYWNKAAAGNWVTVTSGGVLTNSSNLIVGYGSSSVAIPW